MMKRHITYLLLLALVACTPKPKDAVKSDSLPDIYPDYIGVTVPPNIAPLNMLLRSDCDALYVTAAADGYEITADCSQNEATFDIKDWHRLLDKARGNAITVTLSARSGGKWTEYRPFEITVSADSIDPYLTYRLIEPDYEVFSRLQIRERCIENYDERSICDYNMVGNRCMNCHTYNNQRPDQSLMYVRGDGGGMILNDGGNLSKLSLKTQDMAAGSVYAQFSPSGQYIVFSSNVIIPAFHADSSKRLEVFDTKSDVYVYDIKSNRVMSSPLLSDSIALETFPTFAPDGRNIYFCSAQGPAEPLTLDSLQYSIYRIAFDETTGSLGESVDTVVSAVPGTKSSVCHPRISPDGRFLLYTAADYGTFPIWHPEADQRMLDLSTGQLIDMDIVNSEKSDTYHSWSTNSRWIVFASKRDDGLYGKPYFCHIAEDGTPSKPFVLPQKYPKHYDNTLKSYNVPELGRAQVNFSTADVLEAMDQQPICPR